MTLSVRNKQNFLPLEDEMEIRLRLLSKEDKVNVRKWMSDPYILQLTFVVPGPGGLGAKPFSAQAADQYLQVLVTDPARISFAIEANSLHVGNIGLKEYNPTFGTTEIFIEIGEASFRGRGIGKAAMSILMDYAFISLGLHEVRLEVLEFNNIAIRTYETLGFQRTHRSGWHYDPNGQYWQVFGMSLMKEDWMVKRKGSILSQEIRTIALAKI